jgi:hypothetical protein
MIYKEIPHLQGFDITMFTAKQGLNKVAFESSTHIPEKLAQMIREIERNPEPNMVYLYDRAMGAGEVYGANNNGDWFSRSELIEHHPSFEKDAHMFRHHQNKDPNNAIGSIYGAAYNYQLDTVDLLLKAPLEKVANEMRVYDAGGIIQTSMGAKVPYDECSICGNKSQTRAQYCQHLKFQLRKILPDGRQVVAKNPKPKFVDLSVVIVGADPGSMVLRKVASYNEVEREFKKKNVGSFQSSEHRPTIHPKVIEAMKPFDFEDAVATLHQVVGPLRPDEFQAIMRKDASLLRPDIIPYVGYQQVPGDFEGVISRSLVGPLQKVAGVSIERDCPIKQADFLSQEERFAYLNYRKSSGLDQRAYLR